MNTFTPPDAVVLLCAAFLRLFQSYVRSQNSPCSFRPNEIVLQLIPVGFVASETALVVPTQAEYRALALEVYERCGLETWNAGDEAIAPGNAPSILLSDKIPSSIDLKLTAEAPSSVLHEPTSLHIAYSQSIDGRWISASWTEDDGSNQMSMSYCLGMEEAAPRRAFEDIAREIWETSIGMIQARKVRWRFLIASAGVMEQEELRGKPHYGTLLRSDVLVLIEISSAWTRLADDAGQDSISLVLLAIDCNPPLSLLPSELNLASTCLNTQAALYTTPVSTPQPSILSPEQFGTVATPASGSGPTNAVTPTDNAFEVDPDSSLVDVTDETWGVVLCHRLHNTRSLVERRPGLASGYLVKRAGREDEDGIVAMSVNLLYTARPHEPQLKEILGVYRGLGTLARLKGLADPVKSVLPWHVAAAVKAQEALSSVM